MMIEHTNLLLVLEVAQDNSPDTWTKCYDFVWHDFFLSIMVGKNRALFGQVVHLELKAYNLIQHVVNVVKVYFSVLCRRSTAAAAANHSFRVYFEGVRKGCWLHISRNLQENTDVQVVQSLHGVLETERIFDLSYEREVKDIDQE